MNKTALVLGAGVAGCSSAILLRQRGYHVELIERQQFPRFSIGESISPAAVAVLNRLGIDIQQLDQLFPRKLGAQVRYGGERATFSAANGTSNRQWPAHSYNVERERFDAMLLEKAVRMGVVVDMPAQARSFRPERNEVDVESAKRIRTIAYELLVDATGFYSPLVEQLGLRRFAEENRSVALFAHYEGDLNYGDVSLLHLTAFIRPPSQWIWVIPLSDKKVSIGLIDRSRQLDKNGFLHALKSHPAISNLLGNTQPSFVQGRMVNDYSAQRYCGNNYFFVGDSAFFVDPIFSSGVTAAFRSAEFLVDEVLPQSSDIARMHHYNRFMDDYYRAIKRQVDLYYEAIKHPIMVRGTLRWWNLLEKDPLPRRLQDWGNGAFNEHQFLLGLWSSGGRRLGRLLTSLGI
ncbi:MAG: NAD(P)/FAD-dependent oxidoreductase [Cellvibrionaceae bacterium]